MTVEVTCYHESSRTAFQTKCKLPLYKKYSKNIKDEKKVLIATHHVPRQCQQMPLDRDATLSLSQHKSAHKNVPIY